MSKKMPKGRPFVKGQSGNISGRPKQKAHIAEFRQTSYEDFINQLQKYGSLTKEEMQEDLNRKDATMFELIFGRILVDAAKGERDARQVLFERLWGKVKDKLEHSSSGISMPQIIVQLPDNGRSVQEPLAIGTADTTKEEAKKC